MVLDHPAGRDQGGDLLRAYYSGESADGIFAAQPVSHAAQDELLQALDRRLSPEPAAAGKRDLGDGSVSLAELEAAAKNLRLRCGGCVYLVEFSPAYLFFASFAASYLPYATVCLCPTLLAD